MQKNRQRAYLTVLQAVISLKSYHWIEGACFPKFLVLKFNEYVGT